MFDSIPVIVRFVPPGWKPRLYGRQDARRRGREDGNQTKAEVKRRRLVAPTRHAEAKGEGGSAAKADAPLAGLKASARE
jgi:hypothetical protein